MSYSIVFSSLTGNTKLLAKTLRAELRKNDPVYFGPPSEEALKADKIYVGFWTDKGNCDKATAEFLGTLSNKEIFLFGTAGFGGSQEYFDKILKNTKTNIPAGNHVTGTFMCQGKMPQSVRERYEKMKEQHIPKADMLIENFDKALPHPNKTDLKNLIKAL